jgi:alpha-D-xyloside xylohydrolase
MKKSIKGILIAFVASIMHLQAADALLSYQQQADGVQVKTQAGQLAVNWYSDSIVRVRYIEGQAPFKYDKTKLDQTMLVPEAQQAVDWKLAEDAQQLLLQSDQLQVVIDKASAQVSFLDQHGRELLSERSGENRSFSPFTVGEVATHKGHLVFNMDDDDPLYGMGQHQDGYMNRRHVPTRLVQHNTRIGLPMVISPAGYGLFFNHMSYMEFNPGSASGLENVETVKIQKRGPKVTEQDMARDGAKRMANSKFDAPLQATASFTPKVSGVYGLYISNPSHEDARYTSMKIEVDGQEVLHYINFWNEAAMGAAVELEAGKTVEIKFDAALAGSEFHVTPPDNRFEVAIEAAEDLDYFFIAGTSMDGVVRGYRQLTGSAPIPPRYMFGFWQCRERYRSQKELLENAREFRERNIPVDVIVQDWQWWTKTSNREFNKNYPNPKAMLDELESMNYRVMFSTWATANNPADRKRFGPELINGRNINVYEPEGRELFWADIRRSLFDLGGDAWWHDGTEGFPVPERADTEFGPGFLHHNDFALLVSKASYEGQRRDGNDATRPVILTRSAWGGQQRYGSVMWSGDISSTWDHYRKQIAAGLNFCMAGVPYWTTDTAGFFRGVGQVATEDGGGYANQHKSKEFQELLIRWMQYSTFCPVQRIHGYQSQTEMWRYNESTYASLLDMVRLRYSLLPYNYALARMVAVEDYTMMRGLAMDFPQDSAVVDIADQFMFGPSLLVCPVVESGVTEREVYLPQGTDWIDFWTGERHAGGQSMIAPAPLNRLPLYVKAGSILPIGPKVEWADQKAWDVLEIRIYPEADGHFTLYEDEGENHNYETGACSEISFAWDDAKQELSIGERQGNFAGMPEQRVFKLVVVKPGEALGISHADSYDKLINYNGKSLRVQF